MSAVKKNLLLWPVLVLVGVVIAVGVGVALKPQLFAEWIGATSEDNSQVVNAITRTEEVALVKLSIEGIKEKRTEAGKFLFITIPNSRATFLRYGFDAKLGIDGQEVKITPTGDNTYRVTVPPFVFIGVDNQHVEVAAENNDVLSWTTPEIDNVAMVNDILDDELKTEYLTKNRDLLQDQVKSFYRGIAKAIDPDATLEFEFAQ